MNPQKKTSRQELNEAQQAFHELSGQAEAREFANVEEMLRRDALHTPVPPAIERRLQESLGQLPPPPRRSWWRRLLGGASS
ncbi:MAG TPA: hypothetical protein VKY92_07690 [Verrucomicrobiae bacterium]|jgi:hypothetical protein|nr:hypothetical protein [Verrucomicrobiae bacterium]